jgi:hypothetical protein
LSAHTKAVQQQTSLSAHTKAVQQQREFVCSCQSSAAADKLVCSCQSSEIAEGAHLLMPKQGSSMGSLSVLDTRAMQQQKHLVISVQQQKELTKLSKLVCPSWYV